MVFVQHISAWLQDNIRISDACAIYVAESTYATIEHN